MIMRNIGKNLTGAVILVVLGTAPASAGPGWSSGSGFGSSGGYTGGGGFGGAGGGLGAGSGSTGSSSGPSPAPSPTPGPSPSPGTSTSGGILIIDGVAETGTMPAGLDSLQHFPELQMGLSFDGTDREEVAAALIAFVQALKLNEQLFQQIGTKDPLNASALGDLARNKPDPAWLGFVTGDGLAAAAAVASAMGLGADNIGYLNYDAWQAASSAEHLAGYGRRMKLTPGEVDRAQVLPIAVNGETIIVIRRTGYVPPEEGDPPIPFNSDDLIQIKGPDTEPVRVRIKQPTVKSGTRVAGPIGGIALSNLPAKDDGIVPSLMVELVCGTDGAAPCFEPAVSFHRYGRVACSGVLIAPDRVLTAAHCVCNGVPEFASTGPVTPTTFNLNPLGVATVATRGRAYLFGETRGSESRNPFCGKLAALSNDPSDAALRDVYGHRDLAIVELTKPLTSIADEPHFAKVPQADLLREVDWVYVAGFGRNYTQPLGGNLHFMRARRIQDQTGLRNCPATDGTATGCDPTREFLLVDAQGGRDTDSCFGDSGGGVFARTTDGQLLVLGIVSRGLTGHCGTGGINALTAESGVLAWLRGMVPQAVFEPTEISLGADHTNVLK